jgi:cardiolipin synthase
MFKLAKKRKLAHSYPAHSYIHHNDVKLIEGGRAYFDLVEKIIRGAKHSIHFQVYIFDEDETGTRVAHALKEAALRGVNVFLLVDGYASNDLSAEFIQDLNDAGVHVRRFEPLLKSKKFYFGRRLHHKVIVVDALYSLVAGLNISDRYNDVADNKAWLDWALFAEGDVSDALARVCIRRYKARIPIIAERADRTLLTMEDIHKNCSVRVRINDWVDRKRQISRSYLEMFRTSKSHITIMSPYFLPGYEFRRKMKQAIRRGVNIRVVQAGTSDIALSKYAERYMYRWLLSNKVEIHEYQKTVLHGKIAVCDDRWMTVGSYNVNNLSAYASIELNLDVDSPPFAREVEQRLDQIIKKDCRQITQEAYLTGTSWVEQFLQTMAYSLLRVILFLFTFYLKQKE